MNCSSRFVVPFVGAALAALALIVAGCASGESTPSGPVGPTVKVHFESQPSAALIINGTDVGVTPADIAIEVDESGFLVYPVKVTWDFSKTMGGRSAPRAGNLEWVAGKIPPATVTYLNGTTSESRDYAPKNPPGTKSPVERAY
jgi:hypothetical protein